jgi:hypothetical protein
VKDRTFFHGAGVSGQNKPVQVIYSALDSQGLRNTTGAQALLSAAPEGPFDAISNSQSSITRLDHRIADGDMLLGRFDFTRTLATNSPGATNLSTGLGIASTTINAASNQVTQPDTNYTALGQWTSACRTGTRERVCDSSLHVNQAPLHLEQAAGATTCNADIPSRYGTAPEGRGRQRRFRVHGQSLSAGGQPLDCHQGSSAKVGVDYQRISVPALYDQTTGGAYTFNSLTDLVNRSPAITQFTRSARST